MKLVWTLTLSLAIAPLLCVAQMSNSDWKHQSLKGKVKSILYYDSDFLIYDTTKLDTWKGDKQNYRVDTFSKIGFKVGEYQVKDGVRLPGVYPKLIFDKKGYLIEKHLNDGGSINKVKFIYDTKGNLIQETTFDAQDHIIVDTKYSFSSGKMIKKEFIIESGTTISIYSYSNNGKTMEVTTYDQHVNKLNHDSNIKDTAKIKYVYDDRGNILSEARKDSEDYKTFSYDEYNNRIREEHHKHIGPPYFSLITRYIYDSHGNWIKLIEKSPNQEIEDFKNAYTLRAREIEYYQ